MFLARQIKSEVCHILKYNQDLIKTQNTVTQETNGKHKREEIQMCLEQRGSSFSSDRQLFLQAGPLPHEGWEQPGLSQEQDRVAERGTDVGKGL